MESEQLMDELTIREFSAKNSLRYSRDYRHPDWTVQDWAVAAAGELGEACNLIKKLRRGDGIDTGDIAAELADCVTYIDLLLSHLGYDLATVLTEKFNIVSDRIGSDVKIRGYTYRDPYVSTDDAARPASDAPSITRGEVAAKGHTPDEAPSINQEVEAGAAAATGIGLHLYEQERQNEAQESMKRLSLRRAALRRSIDSLENKISGNRCTDAELAWAQHYANLARDLLACQQLLQVLEPQAPISALQ